MKKRWLAGILCVTMILSLSACGIGGDPQIQSNNLMQGIEPRNESADASLLKEDESPIADFGIRLMQTTMKNAKEDENVLISPLSVILAMYMTANGAAGETKAQMMEVLGEDLDEYLYAYQTGLPQGDKYKINIANGIWFKDVESLQVKEDFLKANQNYFNAALYKAPFNETTCREINNWVKENTDGMIDSVLDSIPASAVLYLINALSFDAEWQNIYKESSVFNNRTFTKEDGTEQKFTIMYSEESTYLEDKKATGFIKYYKDKKYAFVALLPKEGVTVAEYVESMDAESYRKLLANAKTTQVNAGIPKFETEYSTLLNDVLVQMGIEDAFDPTAADLSAMATSAEGNLYINRVIHKTFISVDERGTKAGAVTAVEVNCESAPMEVYTVHLNRPFVYMLIDCETNQPFFIGTLMDVEK